MDEVQNDLKHSKYGKLYGKIILKVLTSFNDIQ